MTQSTDTGLLKDHTILEVVHAFPPHSVTGVEQHVFALSRELARANRVHVLCRAILPDAPEYAITDDRMGDVAVRRIAARTGFGAIEERAKLTDPAIELAFIDYIEEIRPDLVHVHHLIHLSPALVALAARRGLPVVVTLHDYYFACPRINLVRSDYSICDGPRDGRRCGPCLGAPHPVPEGQGALITLARKARMRLRARGELRRATALLRRQARDVIARGETVLRDAPNDVFAQRREWAAFQVMQADALVAPSRSVADMIACQCPGLSPIRVVGHGIDVEPFRAMRRTPSEIARFGFLGTIIKHKGVDVLLRAFGRLPSGAASLAIHGVVGDEAYAEQVRRLAGEVGAAVAGSYRPEDLPRLLSEIDVVVVPSVVLESFGLVAREAFAGGAPVIASRIGALEEAVRDGVDGLLVTPGSVTALAAAMRRFVDEPGLLDAMRARLPRVKTSAENAAEIAAIYREVLAGKGRP